ncbi:hypothetical protein [Paraburkholderia terrae]|nr:hypothetical protein [Paraburkholderia terrae]
MYRKLAISFLLLIVLADGACAVGRMESGFARDIGTDHFPAGRIVEIATPVAGDAIAAGEGVTRSSNVSGDVVLTARSVQVGGGVERLATPGPTAHARAAHRIGRWIWTIGLMVVAACLVAALPVFGARASERVRERVVRNILLAFALIVCVPVATILLLAKGIGAPLGLLAALAFPGLLLVGYVSTGITLGDAIPGRARRDHATADRWRASFAALGTLAIALIGWIPLVGSVITFVALLLGVGAVVFQVWAATSGGNSLRRVEEHPRPTADDYLP